MKKVAILKRVPDPSEFHTFSGMLESLEGGIFHDEASEAMRDLIGRLVQQHQDSGGQPHGKMTVTVIFKSIDGVIVAEGSFRIDSPRTKRPSTSYYATRDNTLTQENPEEPELPLKKAAQ